jgi:hypothetical protein
VVIAAPIGLNLPTYSLTNVHTKKDKITKPHKFYASNITTIKKTDKAEQNFK